MKGDGEWAIQLRLCNKGRRFSGLIPAFLFFFLRFSFFLSPGHSFSSPVSLFADP